MAALTIERAAQILAADPPLSPCLSQGPRAAYIDGSERQVEAEHRRHADTEGHNQHHQMCGLLGPPSDRGHRG